MNSMCRLTYNIYLFRQTVHWTVQERLGFLALNNITIRPRHRESNLVPEGLGTGQKLEQCIFISISPISKLFSSLLCPCSLKWCSKIQEHPQDLYLLFQILCKSISCTPGHNNHIPLGLSSCWNSLSVIGPSSQCQDKVPV